MQGKGLVPTFLLRKNLASAPCSGRCPETPVKQPRRASLDLREEGARVFRAEIGTALTAEDVGFVRGSGRSLTW